MRNAIQYIIMVIPVLVIIYFVDQYGETLTAPPSIHGEWRMIQPASMDCAAFTRLSEPLELDVRYERRRESLPQVGGMH
jgi:hypothetical protein